MKHTLPGVVRKADTIGVFVPSLDESSVEDCLDREYSASINELSTSILQYPEAVLSSAVTMSNLGLSSLHQLFSLLHCVSEKVPTI